MRKVQSDVGDRMEAEDVRLQVAAAKTCRSPPDYVMWRWLGEQAVRATRAMTAEQRAVFTVAMENAVRECRAKALTNAPHRLQAALDLAPVRPQTGFDEED